MEVTKKKNISST